MNSISYHTFRDLNIFGIYDHSPLLSHYHLPSSDECQDKRIMDAGCASGFFSKILCERGANVTAIDINTTDIRRLKELSNLTKLDIVDSDIHNISYVNEFDYIICGSLLMHVIFPMKVLDLLYLALKPGGQLILTSGGIEHDGAYMRVEKVSNRDRTYFLGSHISLWWLSPLAGQFMLETTGFKNCRHVDSFVLSSTPAGIAAGQNHTSLHHVWIAEK